MISDTFTIAIFASIATFVIGSIIGVMLLLLRNSQQMMHYNFELQRASLSKDREFYEKQLANAALQMTAAEDRWKDVNHLILSKEVLAPQQSSSTADTKGFLRKFGIDGSFIEVDKKLAMILTPFSVEEAKTYSLIHDACEAVGMNAIRGDEQFIEGAILSHIVELIVKSRLVIANISYRNPNVFYELGITHALNKPTIIISRSLAEVPFDLKTNRIVVYNHERELKEKLTQSLAQVLLEIGQ